LSSRITDVDVVIDLMIHDIDLALHLNGPVTAVAAHGLAGDGMIDFASALLTHANGRFSRVQASRITDKKMRSIQATCRDMFIDCELLRKEIIISRQSQLLPKAGTPYLISSVEETLAVQPQEALLSELQRFVSNAKGDLDGKAVPTVDDAVMAIAICEDIRKAVLQ
jgi:predicted dehydrogenase